MKTETHGVKQITFSVKNIGLRSLTNQRFI